MDTPDIRPVRCRLGFIRFDLWLAGFAVPSFAAFKDAGFGYDGLNICYPDINSNNRPMWELQRVRLHNLQTYSFALPSLEALHAIGHLSPLVEIGAGTGCWAKLLTYLHVNVIATDAKEQSEYPYVQRAILGQYFPVEKLMATEAVTKYPNRNVLSVWPCLDNPWMRKAAEAMRPGMRLALVHAGRRGCIGDDGLFDCLDQNFVLETEMAIPRWPGLQDRLGIWKKL